MEKKNLREVKKKKKKKNDGGANVVGVNEVKCKAIDVDYDDDNDDYDVTNGSRLRPIEIYFISIHRAEC